MGLKIKDAPEGRKGIRNWRFAAKRPGCDKVAIDFNVPCEAYPVALAAFKKFVARPVWTGDYLVEVTATDVSAELLGKTAR